MKYIMINLGYFLFYSVIEALVLYLFLAFICGSWNVMNASQDARFVVGLIWVAFNVVNYLCQFIND